MRPWRCWRSCLPRDGDEPSDGPTVWLECEFSPTPDDGYVVVARDVTARKQMEDDRADFLTTVSFELRTPLAPAQALLGDVEAARR